MRCASPSTKSPLGYVETPSSAFRLWVAQGDPARRLAEQVALMVMPNGHHFAFGRPERHLGVDQSPVAVIVDVHHLGRGRVLLSRIDRRLHLPLLAHPQVAEGVLEASARKAAVNGSERHRGCDGCSVWLVVVPVGVYFQTHEVVVQNSVVGDELPGTQLLADIGFFGVVRYVCHSFFLSCRFVLPEVCCLSAS